MKQTLIPEQVFDGERLHQQLPITFDNGRIVAFDTCVGVEPIKVSGTLIPGFIDLQVNGGGGVLLNSQPTVDGIKTIAQAHAKFGTTGFLPTLITDDVEVMARAADAIAKSLAENVDGVLGVHFEGPHLSVPKKGVHPQSFIRHISDAELEIFSRQDLGTKLVTLAPETVAPAVISALVEQGVRVCLGHSNADYETVVKALEAGATGFTHLFNAMSPMDSRAPGMVGAAIESRDAWCGLIVDGHHVHAASAKVAIYGKPKGKVMLVTDAMPPVGLDDNASFELFGTQVVRQGDRLNAATGELAGCVLDMIGAVNNCVNMLGVDLEEAIRMASLYPAQFMGHDKNRGQLKVGYCADMVLLDNQHHVRRTYIKGKLVYQA